MVSWTKPDQAWSSLALDMNSNLKMLVCKKRVEGFGGFLAPARSVPEVLPCQGAGAQGSCIAQGYKGVQIGQDVAMDKGVRLLPLLLLLAAGHSPFSLCPCLQLLKASGHLVAA